MNHRIAERLFLLLALTCLLLPATTLHAQERHYVIALDDSGSMGNPEMRGCRNCNPGNDPHRLARFATRALIDALPDEARATVITLGHNGSDSLRGLTTVPIPRLGRLGTSRGTQLRGDLHRLLDAPRNDAQRGDLTAHDVNTTPCRRVLDGIKEQLNASWMPRAVQTAIFLTDGHCNDRTGDAEIRTFLNELKAEQAATERTEREEQGPRPFQFHLICLGNEGCSESLQTLARETGGSTFSITESGDLAVAFGQILANSQQVCPTIIDSSEEELPHFPGSSGTRLMLFPRENTTAEIQAPERVQVHEERNGDHYWGEGHVFRYRTGLLPRLTRAIPAPVTGEDDWTLLAIPEYRELRAVLRVLKGECQQGDYHPDATRYHPGDQLAVGDRLCLELTLQGSDGQVLNRSDIQREITASFTIDGEEKGQGVTEGTNQARWIHPLHLDEPRHHTFSGQLRFGNACLGNRGGTGSIGTISLNSEDFSGQASQVNFSVSGMEQTPTLELKPGSDERFGMVRFGGSFERNSRITVSLQDPAPADSPHHCVRLRLGDHELSADSPSVELANIASGSELPLRAVVDEDCGFEESREPIAAHLSFALHEPQTTPEPIVVRYTLDNTIDLERAPSLQVQAAGDPVDLGWGPRRPNTEARATYRVTVNRMAASPALPEQLQIELMSPRDAARQSDASKPGEGLLMQDFEVGGSTQDPLVIRVRARRCCDAGTWSVPLELMPVRADGSTGAQRTVDLQVEVLPGSWWSCYGVYVLIVLGLLLLLLLLWMLRNFLTKIHLLPEDPRNAPTLTKLVKAEDDAGDPYHESTQAWSWRNNARLGSRFGRRVSAAASSFFPVLLKGEDWYEVALLTRSGSGWAPIELVPSLGRITKLDVDTLQKQTGSRKAGLYFRATSKGELRVSTLPPEGLVLVRRGEVDELLRELDQRARGNDEGARLLRRSKDSVHEDLDILLVQTNAHSAASGDLFGFRMKAG